MNEERVVAPREEKETTEQENTTVSAIIEVDENFAAGLEAATKSGESPLEGLGAVHYERVFPYAGEFEERTRKAGLHLTLSDIVVREDTGNVKIPHMTDPEKDEGLLPDAIEDKIIDAIAGWLKQTLLV